MKLFQQFIESFQYSAGLNFLFSIVCLTGYAKKNVLDEIFL